MAPWNVKPESNKTAKVIRKENARKGARPHQTKKKAPHVEGFNMKNYINDIVDGHFKALERLELIDEYEVYNLGTGSYTSVFKLIETLEKVNGLKIDYKITSRRAGDLARSYADPSKANEELNWEARYNLETMCKDAWEAIKNGVN